MQNEKTIIEMFDQITIDALVEKFGKPNLDSGIIFNQILKYNPDQDSDFVEIFFKTFFIETDNIKKCIDQFTINLENKRLIFLHSYAKNGKSTFIKKLISLNKEDPRFDFYRFDFGITDTSEIELNEDDFGIKCYHFYKYFLSRYSSEGVATLKDCLRHIISNRITKEPDDLSEIDILFNDLFLSIRNPMLDFLLKEEQSYSSVLNYIKNTIESSKSINVYLQLLQLLILTILKIKSKNTDQGQFIFYLDNIDDILTDYSDFISSKILSKLYDFIFLISIHINSKFKFLPDYTTNQYNIKIVLAYRTANYVTAINFLEDPNSSHRERAALLNAPTIKLSTVNNSSQIMQRKLLIYETVCNKLGLEYCEEYLRLKQIIKLFDTDSELRTGFLYIYRLWNGNRIQFINCIDSFKFSSFSPDEIENANTEVVKGIFIYYVIRYFNRLNIPNTTTDNISNLSNIIEYCFNSYPKDKENQRCNLLRIVLSFIINNLDADNKLRRTVSLNTDIAQKGIGLYELLSYIDRICYENGSPVYIEKDHIELFNMLFSTEYDEWGHFLTCYKKTTFKNNKGQFTSRKKYDVSKEITEYFNTTNKESIQERLNSIRIYYNDNAFFFENNFRRHFEYFAFSIYPEIDYEKFHCLSQFTRNKKPLPQLFTVIKMNSRIYHKAADYYQKYTFIGEDVLKKVFEKVKTCLDITVDFYLDNMNIDHFEPIRYCGELSCSLNQKFYFDDLVSKHISYIEKIRQDVIKQQLVIKGEPSNTLGVNLPYYLKDSSSKIIKDINMVYTESILKYLNLFFRLCLKIENHCNTNRYKLPNNLTSTKYAFTQMEKSAKDIRTSKYSNFTIKIEYKKRRNVEK